MNWETVTLWIERVKAIVQVVSILGPILIVPAWAGVRSVWRQFRKLRSDVHKILAALRVLANRERRALDISRRLIWAIRFEEKRGVLSHETVQVLQQLQRETDELRDTAFRSPELRRARLEGRRENLEQGELDANPLAILGEQ